MKNLKKIASLLLAVVMILGSSLNVFADTGSQTTEELGEIRISGANPGETYTGYKIFDVSYSTNTDSSKNYAYTISTTSPVLDLVKQYTYEDETVFTLNLSTSDTRVYEVTIAEHFDDEVAAADFAKYLSDKLDVIALPADIPANKTVAADITTEGYVSDMTNYVVKNNITEVIASNQEFVYWENLSLGYWFVTTTSGTLCNLTTITPSANIADKNPDTSIDKKVQEDYDNKWKDDYNTAEIGDTVEYKTIIKAQKGAINYKLYDSMTEGLTLNNDSISVFVDADKDEVFDEGELILIGFIDADKDGVFDEGETVLPKGTTANGTDAVYYVQNDVTITKNENVVSCDFVVVFDNAYLETISAETWLVVLYDAILNENAEIYQSNSENTTDYEINDTVLTYGNATETTWDTTKTYSLFFDLIKVDSAGKPLSGAQFELYYDANCTQKVDLVDKGSLMYRVATDEEKAAEGFTSAIISAGHADISGLDANTTYYLKEVKAPNGYNMVDGIIKVDIGANSLASTYNPSTNNIWNETMGGIGVVNKTGTELPSTGGIGTTIFYIAGGVLVIGAVVLLVTRKRMSNEA